MNKLNFKYSVLKALSKITSNSNNVIKIQLLQLTDYIKNFKPTVVFFVGVFFLPVELLALCKEKNVRVAAWAGDAFGEEKREFKNYIDYLYVSDSALLEVSKKIGFNSVELLQFGYNPKLHFDYQQKRDNYINFIGSFTKERDEIFSYLTDYNLHIEGINWDKLTCHSDKWIVKNGKLNQKEVVGIYNSTISTLNVAQKDNVINMVNMRTFEAIASGSCMLNDYVKDIELCFEPNKEILVYKNKDELLELTQKVLHDRKFVDTIVKNGIHRMKNDGYSYKEKANYILSKIG